MGEAAGVAASMASVKDIGFREVSIPELQRKLIKQGAYLGDNPGLAYTDNEVAVGSVHYDNEN
ncbi:hypothetical protein D3C87_2128370 [compost metagenome]